MPRRVALACLGILLIGGVAQAADAPAGGCGDQSKVAPEKRVTNTARWTTAIDMLRNTVGSFDSTDVENASHITQVAGNMGGSGLQWT